MKMNKLLVCALAASATLVACGGVEGTYALDKTETKKSMEADIAKLPANEQQFAKLGLAMMDTMDATLDIKKDNTISMKMTMPSMDGKDKKTDEETGTWKKDGDDVILTAKGKDTKCAKSGKKLTCVETSKSGSSTTMVFVKS